MNKQANNVIFDAATTLKKQSSQFIHYHPVPQNSSSCCWNLKLSGPCHIKAFVYI